MYPGSIIRKVGRLPGKTLAVFSGIHGNEKVGVLALKKIVRDIKIESGIVYFVFANPPAIARNKRAIQENLNRLFSREVKGSMPEHKRAKELMDILDKCDALLDIHSYNSKTGKQFAISEKRGFSVLKKMNFGIIASGFSRLSHGTDGYMEKQKKIGICLECGTTNRYKKFLELAEDSIYQFLQYFKCIKKRTEYSSVEQRYIRVKRLINKKSSRFKFTKRFKDFDVLPTNRAFALDGNTKLFASKNECILFPRSKVRVGGEACIIGEFISGTK